MINILIWVKPFYFNYILHFRFPLHNSTGEARPHLPPLTARPCFCPSSLLISKKKKKKVTSPNCSTYLLVFCWFPTKKSHHLETAVREWGVWMGMLGILEGQSFCLGGCRLLLHPLVAALEV